MKFDSDATVVQNGPADTALEAFNMEEQRSIVLAKAGEKHDEIMALTNNLDLTNQASLVSFGKEAAEEISKCSDTILRSMEMNKIDQASNMLNTLGKIMDKFDAKELSEPKGFLQKIFHNARKALDAILSKYNTMGAEVDKIYIELKSYESEIGRSNDNLEQLFESNINYYQLLSKYILAGEEAVKMVGEEKSRLEAQLMQSGDQTIQFRIQNVEQGQQILEQRVHDLRMAENVAMQSIPMIKAMQFSNIHLVRKINSAFIITLPIFKQGLTQAIMLKRQRLQADALSALDQRTNEMLIKNAQNTVDQTKIIANLAGSSSIKIETLEKTFATIVNGIDEVKKIQADATVKRADDKVKLEKIKQEYAQKILHQNGAR